MTFKPTTSQVRAYDLLTSDAVHCALGGGSRSGKTFWLIRALVMRANLAPGSRHGIFRYRFNALEGAVIYDTFPKVLQICFPDQFYDEKAWSRSPGKYYYKFPNGSEVWFGGLGDKDQVENVLGKEFVTMYFNECSQIPWHSITIAKTRLAQKCVVPAGAGLPSREMAPKAYYDFNPPSKRHWTYQYFVDKRDPESRQPIRDQFSVGYQMMNPDENSENLTKDYLNFLDSLPTKARNRFKLGLFADDSDGSLWTTELLDYTRYTPQHHTPLPKFIRIIVAVDPSGCAGPEDTRSDEVGIVVAALGTDGHGYLLEDLSGRYGPAVWGEIVSDAYERHQADKVVAERNFGGEMVAEVIRAHNPNLNIGLVTATRGKVVRAEPIAALYDLNKMHHVGHFPEIEDQLCAFTVTGYQGLKSPDRADAMVWAMTELFPGITQKAADEGWVKPQVHTRDRLMSRYNRR